MPGKHNTGKTHAVSIYRWLDAGTRSQALSRAREQARWKAGQAFSIAPG